MKNAHEYEKAQTHLIHDHKIYEVTFRAFNAMDDDYTDTMSAKNVPHLLYCLDLGDRPRGSYVKDIKEKYVLREGFVLVWDKQKE